MQLDKILLKILNLPEKTLGKVSRRELKILRNLGKLISTAQFITENQGKLLVKILNENLSHFDDLKDEITVSIEFPTWSRPFRILDKTKKIYLSSDNSSIRLEFAYSSSIKKVLQGIWRDLSGISQDAPGKIYTMDLTEKNIIKVVDTFQSYEFDIDEKILDFYKIIKSWSEIEIKNQFFMKNLDHAIFQKTLVEDIGHDHHHGEEIIFDRRIRYQYFLEKTQKTPENLTEIIALRKNSKIWVDKKTYALDEIIKSLKKLKRLPLLVIFDHSDPKKCMEDLINVHKSLEVNEIFDNVGIYFRLDNTDHGLPFNKFISDKKYNSQLNLDTKIVGVQNGKIPKFFLKTDWKPMSVISLGSPLKQTKTGIYANNCDLIINFSDQEPIIEATMP